MTKDMSKEVYVNLIGTDLGVEVCKFCGKGFRSRNYYTETHYKYKQKEFFFTNSTIGVRFRFHSKKCKRDFLSFLAILPEIFDIFCYEREKEVL